MITIVLKDFRCQKCHKLLGKYLECVQLEIKCPRCGTQNCLREKVLLSEMVKSSLSTASAV
ncbi:MAG: Com family DNA-binding transcriptional regulator [Syntrophomonas sp.]|nr:Com family DNA-binding transcriptional regulator [Syntrophomonas sp.]